MQTSSNLLQTGWAELDIVKMSNAAVCNLSMLGVIGECAVTDTLTSLEQME